MPRDRWALKNTMATKAWLQHFKGQIIQTGLVSDARLMAEASIGKYHLIGLNLSTSP